MLEVGNKAPEFSAPNQDEIEISLRDLKGKWIVLYFYPKDNTPGCTQQAIDFTDKLEEFEQNNTIILGVSRDDPTTHEHFKELKNLKITLLSDTDLEVIPLYGAWVEKNMEKG